MVKSLIAGGMALALAASALSATLLVSGGKLAGAQNVKVGDDFYDVAFVDSSCISAFGGCDQNSDFAFTTQVGATAAVQALFGQVFRDTLVGAFDSDYTLTLGCGTNAQQRCNVFVPYTVTASAFNAVAAENRNGTGDAVAPQPGPRGFNFGVENSLVFARFTAVTPVPEPAGWALMIGGFGLVGAAGRRRRRIGPSLA